MTNTELIAHARSAQRTEPHMRYGVTLQLLADRLETAMEFLSGVHLHPTDVIEFLAEYDKPVTDERGTQ